LRARPKRLKLLEDLIKPLPSFDDSLLVAA